MWNPFRKKEKVEDTPQFIQNENCFIAISVDDKNEMFFDFGFDNNSFDNFINMFVGISTGVLCASMCEQILAHLHNTDDDEKANQFILDAKRQVEEIIKKQMVDEETEYEEPVVSPLNVFSQGEN